MWKFTAAAVVAAVLALVLKKQVPELALLLALLTAVLLICGVFSVISAMREFLDALAELAGLRPAVLTPLLKTLVIAIVCRLAADVCRDASQMALASSVELAGTVMSVYVSLPLLHAAVEMIRTLI